MVNFMSCTENRSARILFRAVLLSVLFIFLMTLPAFAGSDDGSAVSGQESADRIVVIEGTGENVSADDSGNDGIGDAGNVTIAGNENKAADDGAGIRTDSDENINDPDEGHGQAALRSGLSGEDVVINVLLVSYDDLSEVTAATETMYFGEYFNCVRIPAYDGSLGPGRELLEAAADNFSGYDIIVFDMGGHDVVNSSLSAAKENGIRVACLDSSNPPYSSNPDYDENVNREAYDKAFRLLSKVISSSGNESAVAADRFLISLAEAYAPEKTAMIPGWKEQQEPIRILYIGPDAPREGNDSSGGMKAAIDAFDKEAYRGAAVMTYLPLEIRLPDDASPSGDPDSSSSADSDSSSSVNPDSYASDLEAVRHSGVVFSDYDVIICDSFVCFENGSGTFRDVFGESLPEGPVVCAMRTNSFFSEDYYDPEVTEAFAGYFNIDISDAPDTGVVPENVIIYEVYGIGVTAENIPDVYYLYRDIIRSDGTDMMKAWPSVDYRTGEIYYLPLGRCFSDVDSYLEWYESSAFYTPGAPYIGIFGFNTYEESMRRLTQILEARGYNVICGMSIESDGFYSDMAGTFSDADGNCRVTCFVSYKNWVLHYLDQQAGIDALEELGVPVVKVIGKDTDSVSETAYDVNSGIPENAFSWMASSSNTDGMIDFLSEWSGNETTVSNWAADRAIAWAELNRTENPDKDIAVLYYNYPPGKEDIGANYLNILRSFAGDGAKDRVRDPSAGIRDPEFKGIFRTLRDNDYAVRFSHLPVVTITDGGKHEFDYTETNESLIMNEANLVNLLYAQGINVGSYAPGVLDTMVREYIDYHKNIPEGHSEDGSDWWGCELIPAADYVEWLNDEVYVRETMDIILKEEAETYWGRADLLLTERPSPENNYLGGMIWYDENNELGGGCVNYIVIPMVKVGDIRIMPEPNRALASDKALNSADYHGDIPPTHQYIAFYFWLSRGTGVSTSSGRETGFYDMNAQRVRDIGMSGDPWKADAIVHFGTHGTHEWLPGSSVGLSRTDSWGPVLLPSLPNIYPYIVANVGEGLVAEYRGNGVIISHMTPPMVKTQLYENIIEMEAAVQGYQKNKATGTADEQLMRSYREIVAEDVYRLGWQDAFADTFRSYAKIINPEDPANVSDELIQKYLVENATVPGMNDTGVFDVFLENNLHNYIEAVKENSLSYGMHTFGYFDEDQVAPMIWNMWSRQGLDDVLLDTYFDDVKAAGGKTIPTSNEYSLVDGKIVKGGVPSSRYSEADVLKFTQDLVRIKGTPTSQDIRNALDDAFPEDAGDRAKQDRVVLFLLGPSAAFSECSDAPDVIRMWKENDVYDDFRAELFDFYWYQSVPENLRDDRVNKSSSFRAVDGTTLNDTKLESVMTDFINVIQNDSSYSSDPSGAVEHALSVSGLGNRNTSRKYYNADMVAYVLGNEMILYPEKLKEVGDSETNALLRALDAGYIAPSPGNDPVQRPSVLPTGRNFYGIDPATYPTPAAWKVGRAMGQQLLVNYYETYGEWPDTVSFMRFGVEFIRDEGAQEACVFYLLGCRPTWSRTGTFTGAVPVTVYDDADDYDDMFRVTLTNGTVVYRPRVNIVYNSAGMRDGYGSILRYIDRSVKTVSALEETDDLSSVENNVRKSSDEIREKLIASGVDEKTAAELATSRVFAQALGSYEIGTGNLVSASGNMGNAGENQDDMKAVTDLYLQKMSYLYTENNWGTTSEAVTEVLKALLGRTDASVFSSSSNLYDTLDNDDVYQYYGVMNMVSSMYDSNGDYIEDRSLWDAPQMYIADTSNVDGYKDGDKTIYTAGETIQKDMTSRYLNPDWVKGMQESGYSGATMMAEFMDNLYGWSVATNGEVISDATWNKVYDTYMNDENLKDWLSSTSPYALQSMTSRLIETARTGNWNASDAQMSELLKTYADSVVESGVACCHHTCGNPTFDKFVSGMMSSVLADDIDPETRDKYWEIVKDATYRDDPAQDDPEDPDDPENPDNPDQKRSSSGRSEKKAVVLPEEMIDVSENEPPEPDEDPGDGVGLDLNAVAGYEMIEKTIINNSLLKDFIRNPSFSASNMAVILFVVLVVGLIFFGTRRKGI